VQAKKNKNRRSCLIGIYAHTKKGQLNELTELFFLHEFIVATISFKTYVFDIALVDTCKHA